MYRFQPWWGDMDIFWNRPLTENYYFGMQTMYKRRPLHHSNNTLNSAVSELFFLHAKHKEVVKYQPSRFKLLDYFFFCLE